MKKNNTRINHWQENIVWKNSNFNIYMVANEKSEFEEDTLKFIKGPFKNHVDSHGVYEWPIMAPFLLKKTILMLYYV